ncbi:hypothetical protein E4U55_005268 [Claviceps digitariae]|nr:hypothetical protein E4U55_005268 [Claviceps digitariae]
MKLVTLTMLAMATGCIQAESAMSKMSQVMSLKASFHKQKQEAGVFAENNYKAMGTVKCENGKAGDYSCKNVDVKGSITHEAMGSTSREGNDIWGWTSDDGREFAIVGQTDGTAFVEITKSGNLKYRGRLPTQTDVAIWRDIKVIDHHAYISSESKMHGMQVFDLHKLLTLGEDAEPQVFDIHSDLTAHFTDVGPAHNVIANPETNTIFLSGGSNATCEDLNQGLMIIDVKDPSKPTLQGCFGEGDYVHDARCVTYRGPDSRFRGREICLTYNIHSFMVYDVTDRKDPRILSTNYYDGIDGKGAYTHQGWELDADWHYMLMDDEQDEAMRNERNQLDDLKTRTYIWDISSLTDPVMTGIYKSPVEAIDHNLYIKNHTAYMANYASGLRVVDASSVTHDPTGQGMREVAYFDCWPEDDDEPEVAFYGAWSSYIWFPSGTVVLNCIETGMFALDVHV